MYNTTFWVLIIFIFILLACISRNMRKHTSKENFLLNANRDTNLLKNLNSCQVPNLTTEQCYKSRFYECPIVNGSYLQCTNNYIPKPNMYNADCGNRTFEMVPYPWKISENCYYNKIGFNRDEKFKLDV
jgi:hypothetical protein